MPETLQWPFSGEPLGPCDSGARMKTAQIQTQTPQFQRDFLVPYHFLDGRTL